MSAIIQVYSKSNKVSAEVNYQFNVPNALADKTESAINQVHQRYVWKSQGWSGCSKTCGTGTLCFPFKETFSKLK